jgi:hypothetical protein
MPDLNNTTIPTVRTTDRSTLMPKLKFAHNMAIGVLLVLLFCAYVLAVDWLLP